jgi:hypothetical protein
MITSRLRSKKATTAQTMRATMSQASCTRASDLVVSPALVLYWWLVRASTYGYSSRWPRMRHKNPMEEPSMLLWPHVLHLPCVRLKSVTNDWTTLAFEVIA